MRNIRNGVMKVRLRAAPRRTNSPGSVPQKEEFDEWVGVQLQPTSADAGYSQSVIYNVQVHRFFSGRFRRRRRRRREKPPPRVQVPHPQKSALKMDLPV